MRKIEQWMIDTIKGQRNSDWDGVTCFDGGSEQTKQNMKVRTAKREDGKIVTTVYLHGNMIAQFSGDSWGFKMCGWNTPYNP